MNSFSISDAIDDSRHIIKAEAPLLLPVAFATFGLGGLLLTMVAPQAMGLNMEAAPWMWWLLPVMALVLVGHVATSWLVLRPQPSVAEALAGSVRLLPRAAGLILLMIGAVSLMVMVASLVGVVLGIALGLGEARAGAASLVMALPLLIWFGVRMTFLWPALAIGDGGVVDTFRHAFDATRGRFARLLLLHLANIFVYILLATILQVVAGSVLLLIARAAGAPELGATLVAVLMAGFNAAYMTLWAVLVARLHARLG